MDWRNITETVERLSSHPQVVNVELEDSLVAKVSIRVDLAQDDMARGMSSTGVKSIENVSFVFHGDYPCSSVSLRLREDFPRIFTRVNAIKNVGLPFVFDGDASELLQRPNGILELVDQLAVWLSGVASGSLMGPEKGLEHIREDRTSGVVGVPLSNFQRRYSSSGDLKIFEVFKYGKTSNPFRGICPDITVHNRVDVDLPTSPCVLAVASPGKVCDKHCQFAITTYKQLKQYLSEYVHLGFFEKAVLNLHCDNIEKRQKDLIFIIGARRPCRLVGSGSNVEFIGFHVDISERRANGRSIRGSSKVSALALRERASPMPGSGFLAAAMNSKAESSSSDAEVQGRRHVKSEEL